MKKTLLGTQKSNPNEGDKKVIARLKKGKNQGRCPTECINLGSTIRKMAGVWATPRGVSQKWASEPC